MRFNKLSPEARGGAANAAIFGGAPHAQHLRLSSFRVGPISKLYAAAGSAPRNLGCFFLPALPLEKGTLPCLSIHTCGRQGNCFSQWGRVLDRDKTITSNTKQWTAPTVP